MPHEVNLEALWRKVRKARTIAGGAGMLAMKVMCAVDEYSAYVKRSLGEGIDALVVCAGCRSTCPSAWCFGACWYMSMAAVDA